MEMYGSTSSISKDENNEIVLGGEPSKKDIVVALAPLLRIKKREIGGVEKEYCIRKCPNGTSKCKNKNAEIFYANKTGFKNPHSHLATCVFKVSFD